jgi:hypothetical protein
MQKCEYPRPVLEKAPSAVDFGGLKIQILLGRYAHNNATRQKRLHSRLRTINGFSVLKLRLQAISGPQHTSEGWLRSASMTLSACKTDGDEMEDVPRLPGSSICTAQHTANERDLPTVQR